jgi:hypothetical protein
MGIAAPSCIARLAWQASVPAMAAFVFTMPALPYFAI